MCANAKRGLPCPNGDGCAFAHHVFEVGAPPRPESQCLEFWFSATVCGRASVLLRLPAAAVRHDSPPGPTQ
jgi:hypothetical protein